MPSNMKCSSLFSLCIENVAAEIINAWNRLQVICHDIFDKTTVSMRDVFCIQMKEYLFWEVSVFVHQDLFSQILKKILNTKFAGLIGLSSGNLDRKFIKLESACDLLEDILIIFGRAGISELDFSHTEIKSSKFYGNKLCPIDIMGKICNRAIHNTFFKRFEWTKSLTSLNLQNAVDSHTVYCISMSCQNLKFLYLLTNELMGEEMKDFVRSLSCLYGQLPLGWINTAKPYGCPNMNYLVLPVINDIDFTEHTTKMLFFMSNLKAIRNAPMRTAIRNYISRSKQVKPLKLIEFEDEVRGDDFIDKGSAFRYLVQNLILSHVIEDVKSYKFTSTQLSNRLNIHEINQLKNLRRLEVDIWLFDTSIFPVLPFITELVLNFEDHMDIDYIYDASSKFPNLTHLSITSIDIFSNSDLEFNTLFYHLTSFELHTSYFHRDLIIDMVAACPKLTSLKIFLNGNFDDHVDDFNEHMNILEAPDNNYMKPLTDKEISALAPYFSNMEIIDLSRDQYDPIHVKPIPLTKSSAELLLRSCPKLKWLGSLDTWSVSEEDMEILTSQIRIENVDVHLSYSQRSHWKLLYPHANKCPEWLQC